MLAGGVLLFAYGVCAQESHLIAAPSPKAALETAHRQVRSHRSIFALDHDAIRCGLVQGGAELFDGVTTRYFVNHCATSVEADPVSRVLIGRRPGWAGMIAFGSLEAISTSYVYQALHRSSNKWLRGVAPFRSCR
jgi:hypothetical protein